MQIIRTIVWVLVVIALTAFVSMNWYMVRVNVWPDALDAGGYKHSEGPFGLVALIFFLLGLLPMWLLHKGASWRWNRKLGALENTVRAATTVAPIAGATTATPHETAPSEPPFTPL